MRDVEWLVKGWRPEDLSAYARRAKPTYETPLAAHMARQ
jgi:hypothetical protein